MILTNIIKDLSHRFNVPLALDENGICTLTVNGKYLISLENSTDNKGFFLYTVLYPLASYNEKELALDALKSNLFGRATGRGSIGYDPNTKSLIYFEYFDNDTTKAALFHELLVKYVGCLDAITAKHNASQPNASASEDADSINKAILENAISKKKMIFLG